MTSIEMKKIDPHFVSQPQRKVSTNDFTLDRVDDKLDFGKALHLLRRTTFGPTYVEVYQTLELGLYATLDQMLAWRDLPTPPLNLESNDPFVPIGNTWVNAHYTEQLDNLKYRHLSLQSWIIQQAVSDNFSLREKMVFFWHNHFGTALVNDPRIVFRFNNLLRRFAVGNFKELVKQVTIEPLMLMHLDGQLNKQSEPNDNYAREFLELFTVGKGPLAGPGDYTTFTEHDVNEIARIMTGWVVHGFLSKYDEIPVSSGFWTTRHDRGTKTLSHRFNEAVIENGEASEYAQLIDIVFQQKNVARFICRKLYRYFVTDLIDEDVEQIIIEPLATILMDNDYEIAPVLRTLLSSEHFFQKNMRGAKIKNPMEYLVSAIRQTAVVYPEEDQLIEKVNHHFYHQLVPMEFDYFNPPYVAGWSPYFQPPSFSKLWINASTIAKRYVFAFNITVSYTNVSNFQVRGDLFYLLQFFETPYDPKQVVDGFAKLILPHELTDFQKLELKEILLNGLHDFEWEIQLGEYSAHPEHSALGPALLNKMARLILQLLNMPGAHLC